MSVTARTVTAAKRSVAMGAFSAAGSLGLAIASPLAQAMFVRGGWQLALVAFLGLAAVMLPAARMAGRAHAIERESGPGVAQAVAPALDYNVTDEGVARVDSLVRPGHPSPPGYTDPAYPLYARR